MGPKYLHFKPEHAPPNIDALSFRAIIIAEEIVSEAWRNQVAASLVERGCLYAISWGIDCEHWHDSIDWANLEAFDFGEIPDDRFVMTTWHAKEPLSEALWFAENCAHHSVVELSETIILHVTQEARSDEILRIYRESQEGDDELR